jgi:hypothetical protein
VFFLHAGAAAQAPDAKALALFESKIRPVLVTECYQCHSAAAAGKGELSGGLRLDTRDGARKGGKSGPAVVPATRRRACCSPRCATRASPS